MRQEPFNTRETAEIMARLVGDNCACNVNGNDERLPSVCKYADTSCPRPGGARCWEQYLLHMDEAPKEESNENQT